MKNILSAVLHTHPAKRATTALAFSLLGLCAIPASASVTYSYTGPNYNLLNSSYALSPITPDPGFTYLATNRLTFSFTLASALAPSSSTDLNLIPISWVASDGKYTYGGSGPVNLFSPDSYGSGFPVLVNNAGFTTDASGNIVGWNFSVFDGAQAGSAISSSTSFPVGEGLGFAQVYDYVYSRPGSTGYTDDPIEWAGVNSRGNWVTTSDTPTNNVPAPSTLWLMAAGLALLPLRRRFGRKG